MNHSYNYCGQCNNCPRSTTGQCSCQRQAWTRSGCSCQRREWTTRNSCGCNNGSRIGFTNTARNSCGCGCGDTRTTVTRSSDCDCGDTRTTVTRSTDCGCGDTHTTVTRSSDCGCGDTRTTVTRSTDCGCGDTRTTVTRSTDCGCACTDRGAENTGCLNGKSLAMVYSPYQNYECLYDPRQGLCNGTIFSHLNKPFYGDRRN